jgi:hypothetical protein
MMNDIDRQEKMKGLHWRMQISRQSRLFARAVIMLVAVTVLSIKIVGVAQADDQPIPAMTVGFQNGTITAINEKTFDINGRTYGVVPDVVMLDDFGRALDPGRLMVSAEVKFHVKKEQSNMIEKMIVTLPR